MAEHVERAHAAAGASALEQAFQTQLEIGAVESQLLGLHEMLKQLKAKQHQWLAGANGEQQVVRVLVELCDTGWQVLPDRRWPGTTRANIDALLVGPGGVFVVDVKNWRHVRIEHDTLWRDDEPQHDQVDKVARQAAAVADVLTEVGLPPTEVVPLIVFTGKPRFTATLGPVTLLSERDLATFLTRQGVRLTAAQVEWVVAALQESCPPSSAGTAVQVPLQPPQPKHRRPPAHEGAPPQQPALQEELLSQAEVIEALREAACAEPIESWMTWLHPSQARLIAQSWSGPARIRGAAGTGKTVVALHRANHLATHGKRVLFTSFVRNLPAVQAALFERLAPAHVESVDFRNVHKVAVQVLNRDGRRVTIDDAGVKTCFSRAWARVGRDSALGAIGVERDYWWEEIQSVIKGRGITSYADYASLVRVGRRAPLQASHREALWSLFEEYESLRVDRGLLDWADVLLAALESVRREPLAEPYDAVIVDEVQDLTCVGVQFLHQLVGDARDGLLLVGDGQQAVYPGGFSLAEAGVSIVGRSTVLERNYRNARGIIEHALSVVAEDGFEDLEAELLSGRRTVDVERNGGEVVTVTVTDEASQAAALITKLREANEVHGVRLGDMALLAPTNRAVGRWQRRLDADGIPTIDLAAYNGRTVDAVKLGTFQRSKGLEFAYVFVPDHDRVPTPQRPSESDDAYRERAELERRHLFVAMTRARDGLWLGCCRTAASEVEMQAQCIVEVSQQPAW